MPSEVTNMSSPENEVKVFTEDSMYELQAKYLQFINNKAKNQYEEYQKQGNDLPVDLQGRVLFDVSVNKDELEIFFRDNLKKNISNLDYFNLSTSKDIRQAAKKYLGHRVTETTTISYELPKDDKRRFEFLEGINDEKIKNAYKRIPSSHIISLQHEDYFQAHLVGTLLQDAIKKSKQKNQISKEEMTKLVNDALIDLNQSIEKPLIQQAINKAYKKSLNKDGTEDLGFQKRFEKNLNKELDNARAEILPHISKKIRKQVRQQFPQVKLDNRVFKKFKQKNAESTPATINDLVHKGSGLLSFIGGSKKTAHDKQQGDSSTLAAKINYSHRLNKDDKGNETVSVLTERRHFRMPSIAVKELSEEEGAKDVYVKLSSFQEEYAMGGESRNIDKKLPQAFHYNLLTSLPAGAPGTISEQLANTIDESNNKQSHSARCILQGAHQYNRENQDKPLCLVQNIPVNGFGNALTIDGNNKVEVNEATIMAKLSLFHTVYDSLMPNSQEKVGKIFEAYNEFLDEDVSEKYFYDWLVQKQKEIDSSSSVLSDIQKLHLEVNAQSLESEEPTYQIQKTKIKNTLANALKDGKLSDKDLGFSFQALSIFAEKDSIGGCKSANERWAAVYGRVAMLDLTTLPESEVKEIFKEVIPGSEDATDSEKIIIHNKRVSLHNRINALSQAINTKDMDSIDKTLTACFDELGIEGVQNLISFVDQAGRAKLGTAKEGNKNTNKCEKAEVSVKNAAIYQAHYKPALLKGKFGKGSFQYMQEGLFYSHQYEFQKAIGKMSTFTLLGAAIGAIGGGILGAAGILGSGIFGAALGVLGIASLGFPPLAIAVVSVAALGLATGAMYSAYESYTKHTTQQIEDSVETLQSKDGYQAVPKNDDDVEFRSSQGTVSDLSNQAGSDSVVHDSNAGDLVISQKQQQAWQKLGPSMANLKQAVKVNSEQKNGESVKNARSPENKETHERLQEFTLNETKASENARAKTTDDLPSLKF